MTNPKVFEFAKEIGMTPLALMDRIREWHLPVKSHMAELEPDMIVLIRQKLDESTGNKGTNAGKKKVAKKKVSTTVAASTTQSSPAIITLGSKQKTQKKEKTDLSSSTHSTIQSAATPSKSTATAEKSSTRVVRRKAKSALEDQKDQTGVSVEETFSRETDESDENHSLDSEYVDSRNLQKGYADYIDPIDRDKKHSATAVGSAEGNIDSTISRPPHAFSHPQSQSQAVADPPQTSKESEFTATAQQSGTSTTTSPKIGAGTSLTSTQESGSIPFGGKTPMASSGGPSMGGVGVSPTTAGLTPSGKGGPTPGTASPSPSPFPTSSPAMAVAQPSSSPQQTSPSGPQSPSSSAQVASPTTATGGAAPSTSGGRKKEVTIGASGVGSEKKIQSNIGKRNIVGRMDLSRIQTYGPGGGFSGGGTRGSQQHGYSSGSFSRSGSGGGPGGGGGTSSSGHHGPNTGGFGSRPPRSGGNIRAGFVAASQPIPYIEDEASAHSRKKDDRKKNKSGGGGEEANAGYEIGEEPPEFDAAEFRKREMVFQPKKKKGLLNRPSLQTQITKPAQHKRIVKVFGKMKVGNLAQEMGIKAAELTKVLMKNGVMAQMNTDLDYDTIALIAPEFHYEAQSVQKSADELISETAFGDLTAPDIIRPPVVTVMGHVDHGKTSLLDAIRKTHVASGEAGGITQHIGAYQVRLEEGRLVTFLDTPGHEAFTSMRARGAHVTDIAVIVVAADDGVMPQTAEAINHAKAARVPMIVAINKMDKPGAQPDRIKKQLTEYEVVPEEWGGQTIFCEVSALKGSGIKELLEQILLLSEILELKANPARSATGVVIEARLERERGSVATLLVQNGTLKVGQHIVAGAVSGRIRSLMNDQGNKVDEALPGMPVELLGLDGVPQAGDRFDVVKDEKSAEEVVKIRQEQVAKSNDSINKLSLEEFFSKAQAGEVQELGVVLKADVAGSLEAIQGMFAKLTSPEVKVKVIHSGIGGITTSDVLLATTSKGLIIGFNVRPDTTALLEAKRTQVEIRTYSIIYELIDDMKKAMSGLLQPTIVEKVLGHAEVRNTFNVPKIGTIAGCFIVDGKIQRTHFVRLIRDGKIIYEGKISSLKRFKDDVREVSSGYECGIGIENYNDVKISDRIEAYIKEEVAKELNLLTI